MRRSFNAALAGAAMLLCAALPGRAMAELPVEQFAQLPTLSSPRLSPGGQMVAVKMAVEGVEQLVVFALEGDVPTSQIELGDSELVTYRWVNDEWLLITVGQVENSLGTSMYVTRLISFNVKNRKMLRIGPKGEMGQNASDVLWVARDGTPRILLAYQKSFYSSDPGFFPTVSMVDVSRNAMDHQVDPREGVFDWIADPAGVVRVGIGSEMGGRRNRVLYRAAAGETFREIGNTAQDGDLPIPIVFLNAPGKAAGFSDREGVDALYQIDLATMAWERKIFGVDGYDIDGVQLDPSGHRIVGVNYTDQRDQTRWFDPSFGALATALAEALKRDVGLVSFNQAQDRLVVSASATNAPTSYYTFTIPTRKLALIGHEYPGLADAPMGQVSTVSYTSRDGLKLQAVLTVPAGRDAKNLPIIVLPHGGPATRDSEMFDWWVQFLADRGYAVLQPNYRGSTGFGDALQAAGDGEWGLKMQDDVDDALAWAVSTGLADGKRACIMGASYGGYVALRAADRNPDLYRCAVSYAGVSDLQKMMSFSRQFFNDLASRDYWQGRAPDFRSVSPVHRPEAVGIPVLVMHGRRDLRVPVAQSRDYAEALRRAGKDVTWIEQPLADHHFSRQQDRLQFLREMEAFLDKHNPAG